VSDYSVVLEGDTEFKNNLARIVNSFPTELQKILWRGADGYIRGKIVDNLTNKVLRVRTGRLRSSVTTLPVESMLDGYSVTIKTGGFFGGGRELRYARIHEYGGVIRPRIKKWLAFKVGDRWVKTKKVMIPERPYFKPAIEAGKEPMFSYIKKEIKDVLKRR